MDDGECSGFAARRALDTLERSIVLYRVRETFFFFRNTRLQTERTSSESANGQVVSWGRCSSRSARHGVHPQASISAIPRVVCGSGVETLGEGAMWSVCVESPGRRLVDESIEGSYPWSNSIHSRNVPLSYGVKRTTRRSRPCRVGGRRDATALHPMPQTERRQLAGPYRRAAARRAAAVSTKTPRRPLLISF